MASEANRVHNLKGHHAGLMSGSERKPMAIRKILLYPEDEAGLRRQSEPLTGVNRQVRKLIRDLKDTLANDPKGVGLAAPQIDIHKRVFVVRLGSSEVSPPDENPLIAMLNPVILAEGDVKRDFDGCLSFPGLYGKTKRPHYLKLSGLDERGEPFEKEFLDFDAVMVHHEIDHLDGILFIDHIEQMEDLYRIIENEDGMPVRVGVSDMLPRGDGSAILKRRG
jgi:peptide deformylase